MFKMQDLTPQQTPNRYTTPVTVEISSVIGFRYKGFEDLQNAYLWVKNMTQNQNDIPTFLNICEMMDYEYNARGISGSVVIYRSLTHQYRTFYGQLRI
jgi:hypothetical protein